MKRVFCLLLVLICMYACALGENTYLGTMMVDHCKDWVSLRDGPGTGYRRLAKVPLFAIVTDANWSPEYGDFTACDYNGTEGFILSKYLVPWQDPEPEDEVRFTSDLGFSFFYMPDRLTVEAHGQSLVVSASDTHDPIYLEFLTVQASGMSSSAFLDAHAPSGATYEEDTTEYGASLRWFQVPYAYDSSILKTYYALEADSLDLSVIGTWPASSSAYWSGIFMDLLRTIQFHADAPIQLDWTDSTEHDIILDEAGECIKISAKETVHNVALLSLELSGSNDTLFETSVLYQQDALSSESPLVVRLEFPGDIPCYGIRLTDGLGTVRQYAISISGRDGALELQPF